MLNKSGESGHPCLVHIYMIILSCWPLKFKHILTTLHFLPPFHVYNFDIIFTSFCFVYPLATYCRYRWFYNFCLLTFLLALYMANILPLLYICLYQWDFFPFMFHVSFLFTWKSPFNISFKASLLVLNSFSFCLPVKLLISP